MTEEEETKLFDGLVTLTEMLRQVQITVLANQSVMMAHLAMERVQRSDGSVWMENLTASTSATLADVILEYAPLAAAISERTGQILGNIRTANVSTGRETN